MRSRGITQVAGRKVRIAYAVSIRQLPYKATLRKLQQTSQGNANHVWTLSTSRDDTRYLRPQTPSPPQTRELTPTVLPDNTLWKYNTISRFSVETRLYPILMANVIYRRIGRCTYSSMHTSDRLKIWMILYNNANLYHVIASDIRSSVAMKRNITLQAEV